MRPPRRGSPYARSHATPLARPPYGMLEIPERSGVCHVTDGGQVRLEIAVMGAGSIGCHLGGALAGVAGVTLIGRAAAMDVVRRDGLTLSGGGRSTHVGGDGVRIATGPDAAAGADYVFVTVKSAATAEAARGLAPRLGPGAVVVSFQNGLRNAAVLREALPGHTVLAGMVPYNVVRTSPGTYHQGTAGTLMIEAGPGAERLARVLAAGGLDAEVRGDMPGVQHAKLLLNLNNAVNALSGLPLRDELSQRAYRLCLARCQEEALAAFRAAGVKPARLGPVPARFTPYLLRLPDAVFRRVAAASLRVDAHARSSMWEDLQRGRPTEIGSLQGEVVALARRHGLNAPANARLIELVREAEASPPGRPWRGPDLLAELSAA